MRRSPRLQQAKSTVTSPKGEDKAIRTPEMDNITALAYDERCTMHRRMDKHDHPERPERIKRIFEKLLEEGLVDRCIRLEPRMAMSEEVQLVHDEKYVKEFAETKDMGIDDLRNWQEKWNSIYACHDTYDAASLACGSLLQCVDAVVKEKALNAVAVIRPPGHHAESDLAYGFCFFNNVAIAAQYARKMLGVGKVLILDWDVHHGNGVQSAFWSDPDVLYVSLHRYDNGRFFPTDQQNNCTDIGEGAGRGFTVNIAWNGRSFGDAEYLEAFKKVVMPIATDFKPELVLVSAGFDAARGDPLGGYRVSPHGYAQMTAMLNSLANGRVILALEGGYNLTSISESMAACVRVLLGEEPAPPEEPIRPCSKQALDTIDKVTMALRDFWPSLRMQNIEHALEDMHIETAINEAGNIVDATRALVADVEVKLGISIGIKTGGSPSADVGHNPTSHSTTGLVFEETVSSKHFCPWDPNHIESPARLECVLKKIGERGLTDRCVLIPPRRADTAEICLYHNIDAIEKLSETRDWSEEQLEVFSSGFDDVYVNKDTFEAALISAGSTIDAVKAILDGRCSNATAFIRPPGHHAMKAEPNGFCIFNNVVIAAKMAMETYKLKRILIVDWDVHHGQGTQRAFYDDGRVLYFSIHRYENGTFWPNLRESHWDFTGSGSGKGYNVNVPLNGIGVNDADYLAIFTHILLPLAIDFDPELVIISAGYDAAVGCPEGHMEVSPLCYGHLTRMLMPLANGRLCVLLEGGYCLDSLAEGAAMTLRSLLGDHCPRLPSPVARPINPLLTEALLNVAHQLADEWPSMKALTTAVNAVLGKLERRPYTPSDPVYDWTPSEQTVHVTKNKYAARPVETVEHFRNVVEKMMVNCSLEKTEFKVSLGFLDAVKCASPLKDKLTEELDNGVLFIDGNRTNAENEFLSVHGSVDAGHPTASQLMLGQDSVEDATMKAFGLCLNALDAICKRKTQCALALITDTLTVDPIIDVIRYAQSNLDLKRVLVVDFHAQCRDDLARAFYHDNSVMIISMHRKDSWARLTHCNPESVGSGAGAGFNVNLIWNGKPGSDSEDLFALHHVILPISYSFNPDLVIVSADGATISVTPDPNGCSMSSAFLAYFVHQMQMLAEGKLLTILKGDVDTDAFGSIAYTWTKSLLCHGINRELMIKRSPISSDAIRSFMETAYYLRAYWPYVQCLLSPNPGVGKPSAADAATGSAGSASNIAEFLQLQWELGVDTMFVGVPSSSCGHTGSVSSPVPDISVFDVATPCGTCGNVGENWICLTCWEVYCSRYVNEHAQLHSTVTGHPIALSMADLSAWCYLCNSYIRSDAVLPAKRLLHLAKFGVEMPS